jgi:hypothetical protein
LNPLVAENLSKVQLGQAQLSFSLPKHRSKQAPDLAIKKINLCQWLAEEKNQKHNAGPDLLRKLWDFKEFLRGRTGSLLFQLSISRNVDQKGDFVEYMDGITKSIKRRIDSYSEEFKRETGYGPVTDLEYVTENDKIWSKFYTDNRSTLYYWTLLGDEIVIKFSFTQRDERKGNIEGSWHPEALKLTNHIISSIKLSTSDSEKTCP